MCRESIFRVKPFLKFKLVWLKHIGVSTSQELQPHNELFSSKQSPGQCNTVDLLTNTKSAQINWFTSLEDLWVSVQPQ